MQQRATDIGTGGLLDRWLGFDDFKRVRGHADLVDFGQVGFVLISVAITVFGSIYSRHHLGKDNVDARIAKHRFARALRQRLAINLAHFPHSVRVFGEVAHARRAGVQDFAGTPDLKEPSFRCRYGTKPESLYTAIVKPLHDGAEMH